MTNNESKIAARKIGHTRHLHRSLEAPILIRIDKKDYQKLQYLAFREDRSATAYVRDLVLTHIDRRLGKNKSVIVNFEGEDEENK